MNDHDRQPFRRRVIKLASNLLGRDWAHAHTWAPYLELEKDEECTYRKIFYKKRLVAQAYPPALLKENAPSRIYIVGSGPSVARNDLTLLEPRSCILLNGAICEIGRRIAAPLAVVIEDERFVWRHFSMLCEYLRPGTLCFFSVGVIRALCELDPGWLAPMRVVVLENIRKPYRAARRWSEDLKHRPYVTLAGGAGLSLDPAFGLFQGGSVAISALQLAIYAQPQLIGLVGIDVINADQPRFYEQNGDMAPSGLLRAQKRILSHLQIAIRACNEQSIKVENYSENSILAYCNVPYTPRIARNS